MGSYYFNVADIAFALHFKGAEASWVTEFLKPFRPFQQAERPEVPALEVFVSEGVVDTEPEGEDLGEFENVDKRFHVYRRDEHFYKISLAFAKAEAAASMNLDIDGGKCSIVVADGGFEQRQTMGTMLMIAFAMIAALHQTLLLHASVTVNNKKAYLFLGVSGTGKSTHSDLWVKHIAGSRILNDDNPAVRVKDGRVEAFGTPWSGKRNYYFNRHFEVGAFVKLEQYGENLIEKLRPVKGISYLLPSASVMVWDKQDFDAVLKTTETIVNAVPVFYLKCRADREAALLCHATVTR